MYYNLIMIINKWIIVLFLWRIILNEIIYCNYAVPIVGGYGILAASEPFYHTDRTVDFNILIYVLEGTIYVTEGDIDLEAGSGELIFLKSGIRHFGKKEIPKGTKWAYVHFYFNEPADVSKLPCQKGQYSAPLPKKITGLRESETEENILKLCGYDASEDMSREWYINLRLADILSFIALREYSLSVTESLSDSIAEYLRKNISQPFSAKALEREFFLSYKRMAALFKAEKGMSMQQYHDRMKMAAARQLLSSTLMPIGEIAAAVGFADPLYFSRRFREITGSSPSKFRRSAAEMF